MLSECRWEQSRAYNDFIFLATMKLILLELLKCMVVQGSKLIAVDGRKWAEHGCPH